MLWSGMFLIDNGLLKHRYVPSVGGKRSAFPMNLVLLSWLSGDFRLGYCMFDLLGDHLTAGFYMRNVRVILIQGISGFRSLPKVRYSSTKSMQTDSTEELHCRCRV